MNNGNPTRQRRRRSPVMGEEALPPVMTSSPSSPAAAAASSSIRFLEILKQPDSDPSLLELDESDVVWTSFSNLSPVSPSAVDSEPSFDPSTNLFHPRDSRRGFTPEKFGLSAALSEDPRPLIQQRKTHLARSFSASTAARPVPVTKLGSGLGSEYPSSLGSRKLFHQSAPVNVPAWPKNGSVRKLDEFEEEEEEEEEEMLPPHVIVARSHVTSTFSVFEGVGRTLKGRDLRRVRNAVFQKTGFLD